MNAHLHRIVFNAARGLRMVVQETARSAGKANGATSAVLATALVAALPVPAQIVGAPGAAPGLRPTVLVAPNGVPLVNIQTPSAAGVSRNLYHQFNVQPRGVILNNSRTDAQTQLGGWVQANPWLAHGPARIILNEVTSGNPTQLRGAIEVGGQRAEVIVANPAGIAVDGATFINASRATLTTGTPQLDAFGGLDGYVVRGGTVSIDGAGLDARSTDYTAILARAIKVNAGLWAHELKVVTGANEVSADQGQVSATTGTGTAPVFALDVAHLGGMYAGKISLVGTEHGVGARNAGTIMAADGSGPLSGPGEFVITAAGRLENIGTIQAAGRADIAAERLANSGRITAGGELKIATQGTLGNAGTLEARSLQLASGGDVDNRGGTLRQTSRAGLTITAPVLSNTAGGVIGAEPVPEAPAQPGAGTGTGTGDTGTSGPPAPDTGTVPGTGVATSAPPSYVPAPGAITAAGRVLNDAGGIYAGGAIQLQTPQVHNNGGSLTTTSLSASGPSFSNAGGTLHVAGGFSASVDRFDNTGGTLHAGSLQIASTGDLVNTDGRLESRGDATLTAGGSIDNSRGTITGARHTTLTADRVEGAGVLGAGIQADGKLGTAGDLRVTAAGALTANGTHLAAGDAVLKGASIDLSSSATSATHIALTATQGDVDTSAATVATPGMLTVTADRQASQTLVNRGGKLHAGQLDLSAWNITNSHGGVVVQTGSGATTIAVPGTIDNTQGRIATNGHGLSLSAGSIINTGGTIEHAGAGTLAISGGSYSGANGRISGNGALAVKLAGRFDHDGGSTTARQIGVHAGSLSNRSGRIVQTGSDATRIAVAGAMTNDAGTIASNGNTTVAADSLSNQGGVLQAAEASTLGLAVGGLLDNSAAGAIGAGGNAAIAAGTLRNDRGRITAAGDLAATIGGAATNIGGTLAAGGSTTFAADTLDNTLGSVAAVHGQLRASTIGQTVNAAGRLQSAGAAVLANAGLVNTAGQVAGSSVSVDTRGNALKNTQGTIAGVTSVTVNAGALANDAGLLQAGGEMRIDTHEAVFDNKGGLTLAAGGLRIDAGAIDNTGALIRSGATTTLNAASIANAHTSAAEQGIEGNELTIATSALVNVRGAIRANLNATLSSSGTIDNTSGLISAGDTVAIADADAADPAVKTLSVSNTGGTMLADKLLTVDAASLGFDGHLLSRGDMRFALARDVVIAAGSETIANRHLSLGSAGNITNRGKLVAGNALLLAASNIDNTATGDIQAYTTTLNARDTVTNRGVIDGAVTRIDAATLTNIGTGRIYGDRVSLGAGTLDNLAETVNGITSAATIAARDRLDIGARTLANRDGSLIFSAGELAIGGRLDTDGQAVGVAATLANHASTIEAGRNARIGTAVLNNTNGGVTWNLRPGASEHRVEYALPGSATRHPASAVLLAAGGDLLTNSTGWNHWVAADASNPLAPGTDAAARLLLPSPDYPLDRFRAYYLQSPANSADRRYQTCNVDRCETTAMPGAWYATTDPIWATFGVPPPAADLLASHPGRIDPLITVGQEGLTANVDGPTGPVTVMLRRFDHPVTQAEYDQWQAYRAAHEALDAATLGFIHTITGVVRGSDGDKPSRLSSIYDAFEYTVTGSTAVLQNSAPGKIFAGGAMNIDVGSGTNHMSQILAGGALTVTGGTIANIGLTVDAPTVQTGTAIHSYVQNGRRRYQFAPYDLSTHSTVTLAAARQEGNASISGSGAGTGNLALGQTSATTHGAGSVQGTRVNPIVQVPSAAGGIGDGAAGVTSAIGMPVGGPIPLVVRTTTPGATVPVASLFRTHPEPGSRHLVESDPRFANHRHWLSSDYLLDALGSDPDLVQKRLGDGFYEQRLIREQVAQLTGHRYLDGFDSDDTQYAALMNAGATFARSYGLRPGVALTAAQMAQLTSDIVWLVEQEVRLADGSTQKVLVPQVYVRVKEGDIDGSGALLSGRSVDLRLAGDLTTAGGTIAGREAVVISAENIDNLAGRITGHDALLIARQDLDVIGGTIDAGHSLAAVAARDINIVTTTRDSYSSSRSGSGMLFGSDAAGGVKLAAVTLDRVAGLYVTHPGGSLSAAAGRDMKLVGAEVQSAGDAALSAGRDLRLDSVTTGRAEDIRWSGKNSREDRQSRETGTTIGAAGSVYLTAGRDLTARASTLDAGRTLSLDAGGKLTLYAGENQASAETRHATGKGMTEYSLDADGRDTSLARTSLDARNIQLGSGGDMTLSAVDAKGHGMAIDAGGKLSLLTQSTTSAMSRKELDNDAAFSSSSGSGRTDETSQYNLLDVQDLGIRTGGGVKAQIGQDDSLATLAQQPGMAWVNQLANDPAFVDRVEWQRVQEEHDRWSYHQSGMGPVTALVVSVVAAAVAGPMAAQAGAAAGGAATSAGMGATVYAGTSAAVQAGVSALASRAAVSLVDNDGDLGRVIEEMGSSEAVKGIVTSMLTAGVIEGLGASGLLPANVANATNGSARFADQLQRQLINGAARAVTRSAIKGTNLEDELRDGLINAFLNTAAAQGANGIGRLSADQTLNAFAAEAAHTIVGCAAGAARTGNRDGCAPGAVGAVVGHLTAQAVNPTGDRSLATQTLAASQLMAGIAGALVGGDQASMELAESAGINAAENNYLATVHKDLSWRAGRTAGLSVLESDLLSAAVVLIDFQGPRLGTNGLTFEAQDVEHSHMHAMCAAGSSPAACGQRIEEYKQKLCDQSPDWLGCFIFIKTALHRDMQICMSTTGRLILSIYEATWLHHLSLRVK